MHLCLGAQRFQLTVHHHVYVELLDVGAVRLHAGEGVLVAQLHRRQQQAEVGQQAHAVLVVGVGGADGHVPALQLEQVNRRPVLCDLEGAERRSHSLTFWFTSLAGVGWGRGGDF